MLNKIKNAALALWVAAIPFLTQVTMSGWSVALESSELTSVWTAIANGGSSLVNMSIQILPYALWFTVIMVIFGVIGGWWRLKNRLWKRR